MRTREIILRITSFKFSHKLIIYLSCITLDNLLFIYLLLLLILIVLRELSLM